MVLCLLYSAIIWKVKNKIIKKFTSPHNVTRHDYNMKLVPIGRTFVSLIISMFKYLSLPTYTDIYFENSWNCVKNARKKRRIQ